MTGSVFAAILLAAFLHALWNALAKRHPQGQTGVQWVALFSGLFALLPLPWVGLPQAAELPWLMLSLLMHTGYLLFLGKAYQLGDFGQIYPLARGSAPLLTLLAGAVLLGEWPPETAALGAVVLIGGILLMARASAVRAASPIAGTPQTTATPTPTVSRVRLMATIGATALCTTGYSLADGMGARAGDMPIRYALWLFSLTALLTPFLLRRYAGVHWWRPGRRVLVRSAIGGALSLIAYGIVIWAMSQAPIGLVAALRESSVLFALLLSVVWLGEPLQRRRLLAGLTILAGILLLKLGT
ncbi:DMT family transporter [Plesiomonas shigelloides]|uniref:DMT family transporter n=1 Tax=Plesiomonas shigelloides TaxID=703 RepID=UPI001261CD12|nr:DMT family transporter [Plesiomonas shigelloides]KAB7696707.1 EamA family transporter [Plesiomonas shigelloides]